MMSSIKIGGNMQGRNTYMLKNMKDLRVVLEKLPDSFLAQKQRSTKRVTFAKEPVKHRYNLRSKKNIYTENNETMEASINTHTVITRNKRKNIKNASNASNKTKTNTKTTDKTAKTNTQVFKKPKSILKWSYRNLSQETDKPSVRVRFTRLRKNIINSTQTSAECGGTSEQIGTSLPVVDNAGPSGVNILSRDTQTTSTCDTNVISSDQQMTSASETNLVSSDQQMTSASETNLVSSDQQMTSASDTNVVASDPHGFKLHYDYFKFLFNQIESEMEQTVDVDSESEFETETRRNTQRGWDADLSSICSGETPSQQQFKVPAPPSIEIVTYRNISQNELALRRVCAAWNLNTFSNITAKPENIRLLCCQCARCKIIFHNLSDKTTPTITEEQTTRLKRFLHRISLSSSYMIRLKRLMTYRGKHLLRAAILVGNQSVDNTESPSACRLIMERAISILVQGPKSTYAQRTTVLNPPRIQHRSPEEQQNPGPSSRRENLLFSRDDVPPIQEVIMDSSSSLSTVISNSLTPSPTYNATTKDFISSPAELATELRKQNEKLSVLGILPPTGFRPHLNLEDNKNSLKLIKQYLNRLTHRSKKHPNIQRSLLQIVREGVNAPLETLDPSQRGRVVDFNCYKQLAQQVQGSIFPHTPQPTPEQVETQYWRMLQSGRHVCVNTSANDARKHKYGFPPAGTGDNSPWNLKEFSKHYSNLLSVLDEIPGVTTPCLLYGMMFTTISWRIEPTRVPWIEYLHSGAPKIWYSISADQTSDFHEAALKVCPMPELDGMMGLPHDITMIPPKLLKKHGLQVQRHVQKAGEYVLVFPDNYYCCVNTGLSVSEGVYFGPSSWLTESRSIFQNLQLNREPALFSLPQLLIKMATTGFSNNELLMSVDRALTPIIRQEIENRARLASLNIEICTKEEYMTRNGLTSEPSQLSENAVCRHCRCSLYLTRVLGVTHNDTAVCPEDGIRFFDNDIQEKRRIYCIVNYNDEELIDIMQSMKERTEVFSEPV